MMSTNNESTKLTPEQRAEISRRNGAKSKGPVTEQGKAVSSQNAVTHGIYSRRAVLANESEKDYAEIRDSYLKEWSPVGARETDLVLDIVDARWRMNRLLSLETATIECQIQRQRKAVDRQFENVSEDIRTSLAYIGMDGKSGAAMNVLGAAEGRFMRIIERATAQLDRLQARRPAAQPPVQAENFENEPSSPVEPTPPAGITVPQSEKCENEPTPRRNAVLKPVLFNRGVTLVHTLLAKRRPLPVTQGRRSRAA